MGMTWNVTDENGAPITDLDGIADALGMDRKDAAAYLAEASFLDAAPEELRDEVKKLAPPFVKKDDDKATVKVAVGQFVSWGSNQGRVDLIVTNGTVPGVDGDVEGTPVAPAARIVVWEKDGDSYKATSRKVAAAVSKLKTIAPLSARKQAKSADAALVSLLAAAGDTTDVALLPSGMAVKTAFERGVASWPGDTVTSLNPQEWGLGRAEFFLKTAASDTPAGHDLDLLPEGHPLHGIRVAADSVPLTSTDPAPAEEEPVVPTVGADHLSTDTAADEKTTTVSAADVKALLADLTTT